MDIRQIQVRSFEASALAPVARIESGPALAFIGAGDG
jgi:hypothetical protein